MALWRCAGHALSSSCRALVKFRPQRLRGASAKGIENFVHLFLVDSPEEMPVPCQCDWRYHAQHVLTLFGQGNQVLATVGAMLNAPREPCLHHDLERTADPRPVSQEHVGGSSGPPEQPESVTPLCVEFGELLAMDRAHPRGRDGLRRVNLLDP